MRWIESERGWGIRPDGLSFHLSEQHCRDFISAYWAKMPDEIPDEYSRPDWERPQLVEVSDELYALTIEKGGNYWSLINDPSQAATFILK